MIMKTTIYYFSGTGNSLYVAKRIAAVVQPCTLVPIPKALKHPELLKTSDERVGIVSPLYYGGLPNITARFMREASFGAAQYLFLVMTAGHPMGVALAEANGYLEKTGKELAYGAYLAMPDNFLPVFNIPPDKAKAILEKTEKNIGPIIKAVAEQKHKDLKKPIYALLDKVVGRLVRAWHTKNLTAAPSVDRNFTVDDTCTSCGICEKVCPVDNITMQDSRPSWNHRCEQCLACMQLCPAVAIQLGPKTRNRPRYHHPSITWEDINGQK